MTRSVRTITTALVAALLSLGGAAQADAADKADTAGYVVIYEDRTSAGVNAETDARERRDGFDTRFRYGHAFRGFAAELTPEQVERLRDDPEVAQVTRDRPVHAFGATPRVSGEPVPPTGVRRIEAGTTSFVREAASTRVAVIDTGVDLSHPDIDTVDGVDCVPTDGDSSPDDADIDTPGHGTHVAGTVAAKNNGAGVTGVAPGTEIVPVQVLDDQGDGTFGTIACGINFVMANAARLNIKVQNLSLGGITNADIDCESPTDAVAVAICNSTEAGILSVVAAGNDGADIDNSDPSFPGRPIVPAAIQEVLTVSAIADSDGEPGGIGGPTTCPFDLGQTDDAPADFSNFSTGGSHDAHMIAAPGSCITSTLVGGGVQTISGTSMSSPHVAGVAALCVGQRDGPGPCNGMSPAQMIDHLREEARATTAARPEYGFDGDPDTQVVDRYYGYLAHVPPDTTAPDTSIAGPGLTNDATPSFTFDGGAGATFNCRIDGGPATACPSPFTTPPLADGPHTIEVRATDVVGNTDATPASRAFTVDTAAPDTTFSSGPEGATNQRVPSFAFAASEPGARFECAADAGAFAPCASPFAFAGALDGEHTVRVRATDAAGNTDTTPAARSFTLDTVRLRASVRVASARLETVRRRGLVMTVSCSEDCLIVAQVVLPRSVARRLGLIRRGSTVIGTARGAGQGQIDRRLRVRLNSRARARLRTVRRLPVTLRVGVADAAGNGRVISRRGTLRR